MRRQPFLALALAVLFVVTSVASAGTILAWGRDSGGTPTGNDFVAISGGDYHNLALKSDGSITSWGHDGYNEYGLVSDTPTGNTFAGIASGRLHNLALKQDGMMVAWGSDYYGQVSNAPTGNGLVHIGAGAYHSLALKSDGSLVSWGHNDHSQVSNTPTTNDFGGIARKESNSPIRFDLPQGFNADMRVGVLLKLKKRFVHQSLKRVAAGFYTATQNKECSWNHKRFLSGNGHVEKLFSDFRCNTFFNVVSDENDAHV